MRVYVATAPEALQELHQTRATDFTRLKNSAFMMTPEWRALQSETDDEVLEFELTQRALDECKMSTEDGESLRDFGPNDARIILVIESPKLLIKTRDAQSGAVSIAGSVRDSDVVAIFVGFSAEATELSWFGPTELLTALEFSCA